MPRALAVVAHFDDAVIWAGGAIRSTRQLGWDWTILCTCAAEPRRREYFLASCDAVGARGVALEFVDHPDGGLFTRNGRQVLIEAVGAAADAGSPDWVFTHAVDRRGEYGPHPNHAEAAQAVLELARRGILPPKRVVRFSYRRRRVPCDVTEARPTSSHVLALGYDDLAWKAAWCARARDVEVADPTLGGVSWLEKLGWPCPNPEGFHVRGAGLPTPFVRL